jgi:glycerophosphoryl diester phosphodiesterase
MALGVDAVEVDIWPTADHRFVLFHDAEITRLTGHTGWTMSLTSSELQSLEIGSRVSPKFAGEHILLLEEALDLLAGRVELVLEVKRTRHELDRYAWIEERLARILEDYHAFLWTLVISFDHRTVRNLHEIAPEARIGMLYAGEWLNLWQEVQALAPEAILPHWAQTTPGLVAEAHRNGLAIYPWVVNHEEWMERFAKMGVDGIITDHPDQLLRLLQRSQEHHSIAKNVGGMI